MTAAESGFLLLTSHLGNPDRKPLTPAQIRKLTQRSALLPPCGESRMLERRDLVALGYSPAESERILSLLSEEALLKHYLRRGAAAGCRPVTRGSMEYPALLRQRLGADSPGCLWIKGDGALLNTPAISLVGSRELRPDNRDFAREVGRYAAEKGLTLVSGNARGADQTAQEACLAAGGCVISIVADALAEKQERDRVLYVSEEDFELDFSTQRALSRNRCIHALGRVVFVAQARAGKGGTWSGTVKNLHSGWSSVVCFRDGSEASLELEQMGAWLIGKEEIWDFEALPQQYDLFTR